MLTARQTRLSKVKSKRGADAKTRHHEAEAIFFLSRSLWPRDLNITSNKWFIRVGPVSSGEGENTPEVAFPTGNFEKDKV